MKQPKTSRTNYRIGEFAEYMGVTPDFLKHYEECGLLDVHHSENGYRYFNFDQSSRILEYMRLRNYGVTVKEMRAMLMADADEALLLLDKKVEELRRQADRISAVLEEHKRVHAWQQKRRIKPVDWEVREVEAHYFLPHTMDSNFIRDERIYPFSKSGQAGCLSPNQPCISKRSSPATSAICRAGASFFRNPSPSAMTFRQAKSWKCFRKAKLSFTTLLPTNPLSAWKSSPERITRPSDK